MAKGKGRSPKVCCITGSGVDKGCLATQRTQYRLSKDYTLNHNNKAPII